MRVSVLSMASRVLVVGLLLGSLSFAAGCRSSGGGGGEADSSSEAAPAKAEAPKGMAPPADHRMAKLALDMSPQQVQEIMGAPSGQARYPRGKAFAPFQYSNDSGWRSEYKYAGEGRIVFAEPRWGGAPKVIRVDYDPNEDGD
jgi:hypothetical protein